MSDCPGYVKVTIYDRDTLEELFRYDILVTCPTSFNVTFLLPNWGLKLDKTFDVEFNDTKSVHRVFLTYLGDAGQSSSSKRPITDDITVGQSKGQDLTNLHDVSAQSTWLNVAIGMAIFVTLSGLIYLLLECTKLSG